MENEYFTFPLIQHIGNKSSSVVEVGEKINVGQCIAVNQADQLGVPIYSSVSGEVTLVSSEMIVIKKELSMLDTSYQELSETDYLELIRAAGIVGLGGAGFPTYKKLETTIIEGTLIINAAECEPILSHNIERINHSSLEIIKGIHILLEITKASRAIIAIKHKNKIAINNLKSALNSELITIHELKDLYPMGDERAVIRETLGKLIPVEALPNQVNAMVINIETVFRIYEAVILKKPFISKDLTLAGRLGGGNYIKVLLDVPLGKSVETILVEEVPDYLEYGEIIIGGPFTGKRGSKESPVVKTTGGIVLTIPYPKINRKIGLLVCACGASQSRMEMLAKSMSAKISGIEYCKQAIQLSNGSYKCSNPGECPGQAEKVLNLKKSGAELLLIGNCSDCTNTVMSIAPKISLPVYHTTDFALRAADYPLIRKLKINK